jgi:hydroxypyruvate isomerase
MFLAQVPGRGEPDSPGELDYRYILNRMDSLGYKVSDNQAP